MDIPLDDGKALVPLEEEEALLVLTANVLKKYDADLNLVHTFPLTDNTDFYLLKAINERVYLVGRNESKETLIQVLDNKLNPIRNFTAFDRYQLVNDLPFQ